MLIVVNGGLRRRRNSGCRCGRREHGFWKAGGRGGLNTAMDWDAVMQGVRITEIGEGTRILEGWRQH